MKGNNIVYLSDIELERVFIQTKRDMTISKKYLAKETRASILVRYVIRGDTWLNDFGGIDVFYLSDTHFEILSSGYTTGCRLGMIFVTFCIIKLDFYVNFCIACIIIIVANDTSHLGKNDLMDLGSFFM